MTKIDQSWIVCSIGGREHYAIPRALHRVGVLHQVVTALQW